MNEHEQGGLPIEHPSERHLDDCACASCVQWYRVMNQEPRIHGRCRMCHEPIDVHPTERCDRRFE